MVIYLVRHADLIPYKKDQVKYPGSGLSKRGINQANKLRKELRYIKFNKFYSSDMVRAEETATILNRSLKKKISFHRELAEFNEIVFFNKKNSEKYEINLERAKTTRSFFKKILKNKGNILIVSHGNAICSMIYEFLKIPVNKMKQIYIENCSVTVIDKRISIYNKEFKKEFIKYH